LHLSEHVRYLVREIYYPDYIGRYICGTGCYPGFGLLMSHKMSGCHNDRERHFFVRDHYLT